MVVDEEAVDSLSAWSSQLHWGTEIVVGIWVKKNLGSGKGVPPFDAGAPLSTSALPILRFSIPNRFHRRINWNRESVRILGNGTGKSGIGSSLLSMFLLNPDFRHIFHFQLIQSLPVFLNVFITTAPPNAAS